MTEPHAAAPTDDAPAADIAGRLRIAIARISHRLRSRGTGELTPTRVTTLVAIEEYGPLRLGDLAAHLGIAAPTVSRVVDVLRESKLVTRVPDPSDHRASQVELSEAGRALLADVRGRYTGDLAQRVQQLSAQEMATLAAALPALEKLGECEPTP
jgi:DNA-binding MarR family transcriptional regulator